MVPAIVLNADELVLDKALIDKSGRAATVAYDKKLQRATLTLENTYPVMVRC